MNNTTYFEEEDLFVSGRDGYHTYRIPAIVVTTKETVLAFCEGRKDDRSDTGDIDMIVKRSTDGGMTWSEANIIWDDGANTCGNPCPVVDRETGTIWLLMTHNLGSDKESEIIGGSSRGSRTVWVSKSLDDGISWTDPIEITETTKKDNWTWYATGPGAGIQLKSGRMVIPCDHIEAVTNKYYSHIIYSDDGGATWELGGSTPVDGVNECEVVELDDGRVLLNMRNADRAQTTRITATSQDGGLTWSDSSHDEELIEPICQASIRRFSGNGEGGRSRILFSNPANVNGRENMTVRLSYDECRTWPVSKVIHSGPSAYSCLVVLPDRSIACFYEGGEEHPRERITLAKFNLEWLTDGKDGL